MKQLATIDEVIEALKDVIDPELGINVVDLGLVYETTIDENNVANLDMTLRSGASGSCGLNFWSGNKLGMDATLGSK
jgi:metal-sulfur cluster biosynthetic enzyme